MADYHVLNSSEEDHEVQVVFHIPIPNVNNNAGISFRTALKQYSPKAESLVPWLADSNPTELAAIQNGEIYEYLTTVKYNAHMTDGQKATRLDERYNNLKTAARNRLQKILKYWGTDRGVA